MLDAETTEHLRIIAESLKRLADHFAPVEEARPRHPATLTKAVYDREERERKTLRETFGKPQPPF